MHANLRVVERPRVRIVHLRPGLPGVTAAIQPVRQLLFRLTRCARASADRVRFDARIDDVWIAHRDGDVDPALHRLGEAAALDLRPGRAAVGCLPERGARAAAAEEIRSADPLVARRVQHVRIARIHGDVDEAGPVAHELHELPALATVGGLVEAALRAVLPRRAERSDVHDVRVRGMHDDPADVLRLLEAHGLPRDAAVRALEDSAPGLDRVARILLAGAGPDLLRVRRRNREGAHGDARRRVEDGPEGRAVVRGLPDTARGGRDKERLGRARDPGEIGHATLEVRRTDRPPPESSECRRIQALRRRPRRREQQQRADAEGRQSTMRHGLSEIGVSGPVRVTTWPVHRGQLDNTPTPGHSGVLASSRARHVRLAG